MKKTYVSLGAIPLSVDLLVEGVLRTANFTGGFKHPVILLPKFTTEDKALQAALEKYPSFGISFEILPEEPLEEEETPVVVKTSTEGKTAEEKNPPKADLPPGPFATVKDAKQWLHDNKDIPFNKMTTKEIMLDVAAEIGIVLEFEPK